MSTTRFQHFFSSKSKTPSVSIDPSATLLNEKAAITYSPMVWQVSELKDSEDSVLSVSLQYSDLETTFNTLTLAKKKYENKLVTELFNPVFIMNLFVKNSSTKETFLPPQNFNELAKLEKNQKSERRFSLNILNIKKNTEETKSPLEKVAEVGKLFYLHSIEYVYSQLEQEYRACSKTDSTALSHIKKRMESLIDFIAKASHVVFANMSEHEGRIQNSIELFKENKTGFTMQNK